MAARESTRVHHKDKTKYHVTNWPEYERGLRSRGGITVWFPEEARDAWTPPNDGRRGGQSHYSSLAILTALTLRMVFHLPLRQTEGLLDALLRLMELDLKAPDHTTEWYAHRHKSSKARRHWRKLHVGLDDDGFIVAAKLTKSSEDDPSAVPDLLEQVDSPNKRFTAHGVYDTQSVYELLGEVGSAVIKIVNVGE